MSTYSALNQFLLKTYKWTALSVICTLSATQLLIQSELSTYVSDKVQLVAGVIMTFVGLALTLLTPCTYIDQYDSDLPNHVYRVSINSWTRLGFHALFLLGNAIMLTPVLSQVEVLDPWALPLAIMISLGLFGLGLGYGLSRPHSEILKWEVPLMMSLSGLIWVGVVSLLMQWWTGSTALSQGLDWFEIVAGIVLFTSMVAYDLHRTGEYFLQKEPDHLACSISSYLDFLNLFIRVLTLIIKYKNQDTGHHRKARKKYQ